MSDSKPRRVRASAPRNSNDAPARSKARVLDVRPMLERGEEPFPVIMQTVAALAPGEQFVLVTPFIPAPLIERLNSEGFTVHPERRMDGSWHTSFLAPG